MRSNPTTRGLELSGLIGSFSLVSTIVEVKRAATEKKNFVHDRKQYCAKSVCGNDCYFKVWPVARVLPGVIV